MKVSHYGCVSLETCRQQISAKLAAVWPRVAIASTVQSEYRGWLREKGFFSSDVYHGWLYLGTISIRIAAIPVQIFA
jgi:hypothetical protein